MCIYIIDKVKRQLNDNFITKIDVYIQEEKKKERKKQKKERAVHHLFKQVGLFLFLFLHLLGYNELLFRLSLLCVHKRRIADF
jgi:hypothetical protein